MTEFGFPRLYEDGTITVCKAIKGIKRPGKGGYSLGKRKKSFELTARKKRLIRCSALRQFLTKKNKLLFATLTFPGKVSQKYANETFHKFVDNLTKNYKLHSYVAVKENHKSGNPHFHVILDIPFTDFRVINKIWNNTFNDRFNFSPNAFTTGRIKFVSNVKQVASYISKYISKAEKHEGYQELITTRIYFISHNVLSNPVLIPENTLIYLLTKYQNTQFSDDHYSIYFLKNVALLPETFILPKEKPSPKREKLPVNEQFSLTF